MTECRAVHHLIQVVGLCQVPRDQWSPEDSRILREAREFIQHHKESRSESQQATGSGTSSGPVEQRQDGQEVDGEIPEDGRSIEKGCERLEKYGEET